MSVTEKARLLINPRPAGPHRFPSFWRRHWVLAEATVASGAVVVTLAIAGLVMEAWKWSPHQPQRYDSDALFVGMFVKNVLHHGWYYTNPSLGAPFGQQLYDFPQGGDNFHILLIKGLGLFSSNAFVVINLFFVATFVLATVTAYIALRCLRVSRLVSAGISILYALLPYHFERGESHLFLSGYYGIPLAVLLVVWVLDASPLLWYRDSAHAGRFRPLLDRRSVAAVACCILLGMTDSYYAAFAVVALIGCGILVAIGRRAWQSFITGAALATIILVVLAINLSPSFVYQQIHGVNVIAAHRIPSESEIYGLKIARLFLPVAGHRIGTFADLTARYSAFPIAGEATEALGLIFSVGLVAVLARGLAGQFSSNVSADWRKRTLNSLALAAVVAILVGAMTGLSGIIALIITPQVRAWNRISVLIAFCAAAGLGLLLDQLLSRLRNVRPRLLLPGVVMATLVVLGSLDQTTRGDVPDYGLVSNQITVNTNFMRGVQSRLPAGAMVFQLPYMAFPENGPIAQMQDYAPVQGYLLSDGLRWSYGAMKGRPQDWQPGLLQYPLPMVIRAVAVAGFSAVYVDRAGYSDDGIGVDGILHNVVGPPVLESSNHALELYDLRPLAATLHTQFSPPQLASMADAALHQVTIQYGSGFYDQEVSPQHRWRWTTGRAQFILSNPNSYTKSITLRGTALTPGTQSTVIIAAPGRSASLTTSLAGAPLSVDLQVPPGQTVVTVSTNAGRQPGDSRDIHLQVIDLTAFDPVLAPLQG